jgi:hypothetical protein
MKSWLKLTSAIAGALIFWDHAGDWLRQLAGWIERPDKDADDE